MTNTPLYRVDHVLQQVCRILKISPDVVLRRASLPGAVLGRRHRGISARQYFNLWDATEDIYPGDDMAMRAGRAVAHGGFTPEFFSFTCSPNIETGLKRLAHFKPLVGPLVTETSIEGDRFTLTVRPVRDDLQIPLTMATCEMVLFLELFRTQTATHIEPLDLALPLPGSEDQTFFGRAARAATWPSLTITLDEARLPLVCENADMWAFFEPQLRRELAEVAARATVRDRVRNELFEAIPAGQATVEHLAARLHMSKRTLQRHLQEEKTSFQSILDVTRGDLAQYYLRETSISLGEIAYLLGYENTASFSRAFKGWFNIPPSEFHRGWLPNEDRSPTDEG